jgi:hypothetical protein
MDAIETHFSLRSRLNGRLATEPATPSHGGLDSPTVDDPFAGDDEPWATEDWAVEDWVGDWSRRKPHPDEDEPERLVAGLVLGVGLAAFASVLLAAAALQVGLIA